MVVVYWGAVVDKSHWSLLEAAAVKVNLNNRQTEVDQMKAEQTMPHSEAV